MAGNRSVLERPSWTLSVWVRPRRDRISLASAEPGTISRRTLNRRGMESSTGLQLGDCNDVLSSITSSGHRVMGLGVSHPPDIATGDPVAPGNVAIPGPRRARAIVLGWTPGARVNGDHHYQSVWSNAWDPSDSRG